MYSDWLDHTHHKKPEHTFLEFLTHTTHEDNCEFSWVEFYKAGEKKKIIV
jgi:hypothetical protein